MSEGQPVRVPSCWIPVSRQQLAEADDLDRALRAHRAMTPEERAEANARRAAVAAEVRERVLAEHRALVATSTGLATKVLDLHRPVFYADERYQRVPRCEGCDPGEYAEGAADFPCETYDLVKAEVTS